MINKADYMVKLVKIRWYHNFIFKPKYKCVTPISNITLQVCVDINGDLLFNGDTVSVGNGSVYRDNN